MAKNLFNKGKRWGFAVFRKQVNVYGEVGIYKSDKASSTCTRYLTSGKKNGKKLTYEQRSFYKGAIKGFQEYYNKYINK